MAYKKYIKRGGKIYGPYIYHSRRVDGKVISEYRGTGRSKKFTKNLLSIFAGIFLLVILLAAFYVTVNRPSLTGQALLDLDAVYSEGQPLQGKIKIFLHDGELIPNSSKLTFESVGSVYEYSLSDLVSEESVEGQYFIENSLISGSGFGYGTKGEKEIFPELEFIILINSVIGGNESLVSETEIPGSVSKGNDFVYILNEKETFELKPRSVTNSVSGEQLSDGDINLVVEGNQVIVSTNYSEFEKGFGEEYKGEGGREILLDLSNLNLILDKGNLNLSISYLDENILTLSTNLEDGSDIILDSEPKEVPVEIQDETPEISLIDQEPIVPEEKLELTFEERNVLESRFGNLSVEATEATSKNGFLTIRYEIDRYWIEFTYSEDLDKVTLERFIEQDRIKWLKDLSKLLSEVETSGQTETGFLGNFEV